MLRRVAGGPLTLTIRIVDNDVAETFRPPPEKTWSIESTFGQDGYSLRTPEGEVLGPFNSQAEAIAEIDRRVKAQADHG